MRLQDIGKRKDIYQIDPRLLKVQPGFNVRDLDSPDERADLDELKAQIRGVGVQTALVVRVVGDDPIIVSGHRRHKVVMELIEEGENIESVPVQAEPAGTDDEQRILNLKRANSGKPLSRLQDAELVRRLKGYGWDDDKIAAGMGWKSAASVKQALELLEKVPADIKAQVKDGKLAATVALSTVKEHGEQFARELIQANIEENKRIKGKPLRVTPKGIKKAVAKLRPQPEPREPRRGETVQPPAPEPQADDVKDLATWPEEIRREHCVPLDPDMPDVSEGEPVIAQHFVPLADMTPPAPEPEQHKPNGEWIEAAKPIIAAIEEWNVAEFSDETKVPIEITAGELKLFHAAYIEATK